MKILVTVSGNYEGWSVLFLPTVLITIATRITLCCQMMRKILKSSIATPTTQLTTTLIPPGMICRTRLLNIINIWYFVCCTNLERWILFANYLKSLPLYLFISDVPFLHDNSPSKTTTKVSTFPCSGTPLSNFQILACQLAFNNINKSLTDEVSTAWLFLLWDTSSE